MRLAIVMLGACSFSADLEGGTAGGDDTPMGETSCVWQQPPTDVDPCMVPKPTSGMKVCNGTTATLDTTSGTLDGAPLTTTMLAWPDRLVVSVTRLEVCADSTLNVVGAHPLVIVAHDRADIDGLIDASARMRTGAWGPGPGGDACTAGRGTQGTASSGGAGGGGGAGFATAGAPGGTSEADGGDAGIIEASTLSPLRGGCAGGAGGDGDSSGSAGAGGRGGGAIQLAVRNELVVTGKIGACGGPGGGGSGNDAGGGGGGSGGGILLESATIDIRAGAVVCANGGGGGGGASDGGPFIAGGLGTPGQCAAIAAIGGTGTNNGRPGGAGGFAATLPTMGGGADEGSGGGGGAVGVIRIRALSKTLDGTLTPAAI